jgi:glycosyltransferase involved in cell wall biosynthesis
MPDKFKKRIVMLSGFRIFPSNTGGHVHSSGILRSLARMGHRVTVYSLAGRREDYGVSSLWGPSYRIDAIENNLTEETNLSLAYGVWQAMSGRLRQPRVWQYALLRRGFVPGRLKDALKSADIILSDMPWCPPIPGPWLQKPWFLVSHNLEHRLLEQSGWTHRRFAAWMRRAEQAAPAEYRDIFPCAEGDQAFFRANDSSGKLLLPLIRCGVDPNDYRVPPGTRERVRADLGVRDNEHLIVFSGSKFGPNLDALRSLREFCAENAAYLEKKRVKFLALGSMVAKGFRENSLIATGRVATVAPFFAAADAGLNPVTRGSGANVKLFEYLATRLPVISTHFGVRGTDLKPGIDYLPYEGQELLGAVESLAHSRTRPQWRDFAESVWQRHRDHCDIERLVKCAIEQRPEFVGP